MFISKWHPWMNHQQLLSPSEKTESARGLAMGPQSWGGLPPCTSHSCHKKTAQSDHLRVGQSSKTIFRWENNRCHSICLDGVWLGAPGLADGSGFEQEGPGFAGTLLWLTRSLLSPLRQAAQQVTNGCFIHSGSRELPAPYLLLQPKFIAGVNHPPCSLHNASAPALQHHSLAASFVELTAHYHLCTLLE